MAAVAITTTFPPDVHAGMYNAIVEASGFSPEALMVDLNHLFDNKVHGNGFIQMVEGQRALWLRTFLAKHYYV
jgi:hypothetical protein